MNQAGVNLIRTSTTEQIAGLTSSQQALTEFITPPNSQAAIPTELKRLDALVAEQQALVNELIEQLFPVLERGITAMNAPVQTESETRVPFARILSVHSDNIQTHNNAIRELLQSIAL